MVISRLEWLSYGNRQKYRGLLVQSLIILSYLNIYKERTFIKNKKRNLVVDFIIIVIVIILIIIITVYYYY